jgi:hypothetical protein
VYCSYFVTASCKFVDLKCPDIDGRIIFTWFLMLDWGGGMDCIDLAQDVGRCQALVNSVMNFRFA